MASDVRAASENAARRRGDRECSPSPSRRLGPEARKVLSRLYIDGNPFPPGEKVQVRRGQTIIPTTARYHRDFHGWAQRFRDHFGYYDVFLISPRGDVLYTVAKETDFASNLKTGPYRKSPLADVFRRAVANPAESRDLLRFRALSAEQQRSGGLCRTCDREGRQADWRVRRADPGGAA